MSNFNLYEKYAENMLDINNNPLLEKILWLEVTKCVSISAPLYFVVLCLLLRTLNAAIQ